MDAAAGYLAADVVSDGPVNHVAGAERYMEALGRFARAVIGLDVIAALGDDEQAIIARSGAEGSRAGFSPFQLILIGPLLAPMAHGTPGAASKPSAARAALLRSGPKRPDSKPGTQPMPDR